jgi:MFS superfamily sulfate permease-like transporter
VADLLSKEVQVGYMNGLAITIIVSQLPKLCGFSTDADGFVDEVTAFTSDIEQTNTSTLVVGATTLVFLLVLPRITTKIPSVLVAIVTVTAASALLNLSAHGVKTVGTLPQGLPTPGLPWTQISDVAPMLIAALGVTLVSLTDTIATSTSFAARRGEEVHPDQELIGLGTANVAAALFQGFAVSTSGSRTAVAEQSGARTQLTGLVGAGAVTVLLLFLNGLLADLPQTALAAIVITAALSLMDVAAVRRYRRIRISALIVSLAGTAGVVFLGVLQGIVVAVGLSILLFFRRNWWPHGVVLGRVPGEGWHNLETRGGTEVPAVVVYRWEAPLFFANSGLFRQQLRSLVREKDARWVVLQCEAMTDIDVTAAQMLERLDKQFNEQGIHIAFVELRSRLRDLLQGYRLFETLEEDHFYISIDDALQAIAASRPEARPLRPDPQARPGRRS